MSDYDEIVIQDPNIKRDGEFNVGEKLQNIRRNFGLSQRELARRANITNGALSMIEQGRTSPSIHSLEKILRAFPMSLPEFFSKDAAALQTPVIKAGDFSHLKRLEYERFSAAINHSSSFNGFLIKQHCAVGESIKADWMIRMGTVVGYLISGELTLRLDNHCHEILEGEGFCFASHRKHFIENSGSKVATLVAFSLAE